MEERIENIEERVKDIENILVDIVNGRGADPELQRVLEERTGKRRTFSYKEFYYE